MFTIKLIKLQIKKVSKNINHLLHMLAFIPQEGIFHLYSWKNQCEVTMQDKLAAKAVLLGTTLFDGKTKGDQKCAQLRKTACIQLR